MAMADTVRVHLESLQLEYELVTHPRTCSSRDTAAAAAVREDHIAKGVVLKDANGYLLAVIPGDSWVRLHGMREELNRELELAPEQEVEQLFTDCDPGAIPCTGMLYDIETIVDEAFTSLAFVYFESGDHEHLVRISGDDFHRLMSGLRHGHFSHDD
ncbi:MAG: YbaK/EbsC family protein [Gammaproteobacteria bacterium]